VRAGITVAVVGLALGAPAAGYAQTPAPEAPMAAPAPGQPAEQVQARFQIAAMEGVLERAVQLGAQTMRVKVQQVAPEMIFINGAPRAPQATRVALARPNPYVRAYWPGGTPTTRLKRRVRWL